MARIELIHLTKRFASKGTSFAIEGLDLSFEDGATTVIIGPSGSGKTTLLKLLAGLEKPDAGEIRFDGESMTECPPQKRRIGMIFQDYALYPQMTAKMNIVSWFVFRKKTSALDQKKAEKLKKTSELLGMDIEYLYDRMPAELSYGEKQRVALGRCITRDPALFLLDEPFANIDARLRERYRLALRRLLSMFSITTVYVTHDQDEAMILADTVVLMNNGALVQCGRYDDLYERPNDLFTAEFINPSPQTTAINAIDGARIGRPGMIAGVRPRDIILDDAAAAPMLSATITAVHHLPLKNRTLVDFATGPTSLVALIPLTERFARGQVVTLGFRKYHLFDSKTGKRLETVG